MYRSNLLLLLSFFTLLITNKCWAQEPTPTTDALESTTATPSSDNIIVFTTISDDSTTYVSTETPTADFELPPDSSTDSSDLTVGPDPTDSTPQIPEAPSSSSTPEPPPSGPIPAPPESNFTAFVSVDTLRDCDGITISWSGVNIIPGYEITYSNGTGQLGDDSKLGPEIRIGYSCEKSYVWQLPPTANVPYGNVTRFTITDGYGSGWRTHVWVPLAAAGVAECPPPLIESPPNTSCHDESNVGPPAELSSPFPIFGTPTDKPPVETGNPTVGPIGEPEISQQSVTLPMSGPPTPTPLPTIAPIPDVSFRPNPNPSPSQNSNPNPSPNTPLNTRTVTVNGAPITIAPFVNGNNNPSPNPMGNNNNAPRLSGGNNSPNPMNASPRPSVPVPVGGNSQGSNDGNQVPGVEYVRTIVSSVGDSTTHIVITDVPQQLASTSYAFGAQQSSVSAATGSNGQKNGSKRGGLPPAAIGIIVGTLVGGLLLWILLVIWFKMRKRSRGFKELEEGQVTLSPAEDIKVTPFMSPTPPRPNSLAYSTDLNAKRRVMQEIIRSESPATSIVDSGTHSHFNTVPLAETESQDPYSVASTSDLFKKPSVLVKSPRGSVI